jgi:uncharacterized Zn-binding protein involved in type VI secretion
MLNSMSIFYETLLFPRLHQDAVKTMAFPHRCPALELGLRSLRKGETGLVVCEPRFAFGAAGRPAARQGDAVLPPDSHVEFHVRVIQLGASTGGSGPADQLEEGQRKRSLGNFHFQYSDFEKV